MAATYCLWVHVKEAKVIEPDGAPVEVQVCVRLGSHLLHTSPRAFSPNPVWVDNVNISVDDKNMHKSLLVELIRPKFIFGSELLGKTSVPLTSVRHSNKPNAGYWVNLFLPASDCSLNIPTQHQICLDMHFELPKDLPPDVIEALEQKLEMYNDVLDKEVEVIETQVHRLISGNLTPPPTELYSPVPDITIVSEPEQEMVTPTEAHFNSPRRASMLRDSRCSDQSLDFDGFDWSLGPPTPESSPRRKRESQPNIQPVPRRGSLSLEDKTHSHDRKSLSLDLKTRSLDRRTLRKEKNMDEEGKGILRTYSPRLGAVARMGLAPTSVEETFDQSSVARIHWQEVFQRQLPEIRKKLSRNMKTLSVLGDKSVTLAQLVDQLKSCRIKSMQMYREDIETFSSSSSEFRIRSRCVIDDKRRGMLKMCHIDANERIVVYKRTLEALLYPASELDRHRFEKWSARKPTMCSECNYLLWGLTNQGVKCKGCGKICHERCSTLCSQDCYIHDQVSAMRDKMQRMLMNHSNRFELLREAFSMSKEQHYLYREEMERKILKMADNYRAEISITVIAVQGVIVPKNSSTDHRVYVSVAVGNERMKTDVFKMKAGNKSYPHWNQEFKFICESYNDPIQLRVWNERDSAVARVATKFTKEGDLFLGEKIIEVQKVGQSQEIWYKLGKRAEKGPEVFGHIKVNILVTVDGGYVTPAHQHYTKLHEQLFSYCHAINDQELVIIPSSPVSTEERATSGNKLSMQLLPAVAQEVLNEFALTYAIEPIFRMMLHIELVGKHHSIRNALGVINILLKNLKFQMFVHVVADHAARGVGAMVLTEEYMDASNFGRDRFFQVLDKLLNSLKLDLQQYREFYPHKDGQKLVELVETFELMGTLIEFQQQAMGILTIQKVDELILDNMKECLKNTFEFIAESNATDYTTNHPALDPNRPPFDFFYQTLMQMKGVILEDRTVYGKFIIKYCNVNFGDVSALEMWHLFSSTIEGLFDIDANLEVFSPNEYITLFFTIRNFYDSEVRPISSRQSKVPEFPRWFVHCVQRWLIKFQSEAIFYVDNAWDDDKNVLKFAAHEKQKLSSSTFQMFFNLHKGLDFVSSLEAGDTEVMELHREDFSMVVTNMVQHYVDMIASSMPEYTSNLETMCMLLNNLQALRINIHVLFEEMGGVEKVGAGTLQMLKEFQQMLTKQLSYWCAYVAKSLNSSILSAIGEVQSQLIKLKGQGSVERNEIKDIIGPLLDMLSSKLCVIATVSEALVLQKTIKEVWYICLEALNHMLLPMLKWEHCDQADFLVFPLHNYTHRQCHALDTMMEIFKEFFKTEEGQVLKMTTIERGIKQLRAVVSLYRETTDMLISDFIVDETRNGLQTTDASCGEVHLEIDAYCHPSSGELDGNIRVISAAGLKSLSRTVALKPFIELDLITPTMSTNQRKFATLSKSTSNPKFNQTFKFTLANNWENSELLVMAKQKSTFGKDRVIGLAIVPFSSIREQASLTLGLAPSSYISDRGRAILNVLKVRGDDNFAKEFVALKMSQRETSQHDHSEDIKQTRD